MAETWSGKMDTAVLQRAMARTAPALRGLADDGEAWTVWPIHTVAADEPLGGRRRHRADRRRRACHDALRGARRGDGDRGRRNAGRAGRRQTGRRSAPRLTAWEKQRRDRGSRRVVAPRRHQPPRLARCRRRGQLRNVYLQVQSPKRLAAGFDWLYGWEPPIIEGMIGLSCEAPATAPATAAAGSTSRFASPPRARPRPSRCCSRPAR